MIDGRTYATSYNDNSNNKPKNDSNKPKNDNNKPKNNDNKPKNNDNNKPKNDNNGNDNSKLSKNTVIKNIKNNKSYSAGKKAAMIKAAEVMFDSYDLRFIAGVLGNILDEGKAGLFESSNYVTHPEKEPAYLKYMDNHYNYRTKYSGKTITEVGIDSAVDIANEAKKSGYQGKFGLGMVQWTGGRTNNLLAEYKRLSPNNNKPKENKCAEIEAQFIVKELKSSAYRGIYETWNNNKTPYNAGYLICMRYESPADKESKAIKRGNNAENIYKVMTKK